MCKVLEMKHLYYLDIQKGSWSFFFVAGVDGKFFFGGRAAFYIIFYFVMSDYRQC